MKKVCIQCGNEFEITDSEVNFYKSKGFALPKRCKDCREQNRMNKTSGQEKQTPIEKTIDEGSSTKMKTIIVSLLAYAIIFVVIAGGIFLHETNDNYKDPSETTVASEDVEYTFKSQFKLSSHFEKHGKEVNCKTEQEYVEKANAVIENKDAMHKNEKEDGDDIYFIESTGEIVFVSKDDYIRTYFIADKDYFERQ